MRAVELGVARALTLILLMDFMTGGEGNLSWELLTEGGLRILGLTRAFLSSRGPTDISSLVSCLRGLNLPMEYFLADTPASLSLVLPAGLTLTFCLLLSLLGSRTSLLSTIGISLSCVSPISWETR